MVPSLTTPVEMQRMAWDQPTVFVLMRIHGTVRAKVTNELIVERCHQSKAVVTFVNGRGGVDYEIVRVLDKHPLINRMRRRASWT